MKFSTVNQPVAKLQLRQVSTKLTSYHVFCDVAHILVDFRNVLLGFGTATSSSFHPASIHMRPLSERVLDDTPDHIKIRVTAFQEASEGQGRASKHVGIFHLPCIREGVPLHYDFSGPLLARTILFELLGDMR